MSAHLLSEAPRPHNIAAESTTPPGTPPHKQSGAVVSSAQKATKFSDGVVSPTKRRYVADTHDIEVVKKIKHNEIELHDRNTVLRGTKANVSFNSAFRVAF